MKSFHCPLRRSSHFVASASAGLAIALASIASAGATTVNLTLYPNNVDPTGTLPLGIGDDAAPGYSDGSWQANVTGPPLYTSIILAPMTLFGRDDVKVNELKSVSYWTKKDGPQTAVDWFFQFYTEPYAGSPGATWYGHRINSEPYFSASLNAPGGGWNQWVTEAATDNRLRFYDSSNGYFGGYTDPFLDGAGGLTTLTYPIPAWFLNAPYPDLGPQEIFFFNLGLGTGWSNGFTGRIDGIRIELLDGSVATVNLEDFPPPSVALVADQACYTGGVGETVTVTIELTGNASDEIVGGQFFIDYDPLVLDFIEAVPGGPPFPFEVFEFSAIPGYLEYAVGVNMGDPGTTGDATMAILTFEVRDASACTLSDAITFNQMAMLPNRLTDASAASVLPELIEAGPLTFDSVDPILTVPGPITIECDESMLPANTGTATATDNCTADPMIVIAFSDMITAGSCDASYTMTRTWTATDECGNQSSGDQTITVEDTTDPLLTIPPDISVDADVGFCSALVNLYGTTVQTFSDPVVIGPTQAPGVWYTDRYPPFAFESAFFDGDDRLKHSIDASDCSPCRGGGFTSAFYDTQGRKYDVPGTTAMSIDLYVPAAWEFTGKRMAGFWGTAFNIGNTVSGFPIVEFTSDLATPRFRGWDNGVWVDMGLPTGFVYDAWYTLEIVLADGNFVYTVGDLTLAVDGLGSVEIGNVILQGHNTTAGVTYDIYWDDFTSSVLPSASDNCDPAPMIVGVRSDFPALLSDPYPSGTTTITWTATDECGNSTVGFQTVDVSSTTPISVEVDLFGAIAAGPLDRCIEFELFDCGTQTVTWSTSATLTFTGGSATATLDLPCGTADGACLRARDVKHTLRSVSDVSIVGLGYEASFLRIDLVTPGNSLIGGNANGDTFIDILDFGAYVGQYGMNPGVETPCGFMGFNTDFNSDGIVDSDDFSFIQIGFFDFDAACACMMPMLAGQERPVTRVRVTELRRMGYPNPHKADLNGDGWVDSTDVALFAASL